MIVLHILSIPLKSHIPTTWSDGVAILLIFSLTWQFTPMLPAEQRLPGGDEKSFGFGKVVVADTFLVWGKTLVPWTGVQPTEFPTTTPVWWRWRIHGVSLLLLMLAALIWRRAKSSSDSFLDNARISPHSLRGPVNDTPNI